MFRKLNLFLALLTVILTISPLAEARGRDGHPRGQETKTKRHQFKKSKGKKHSQLTAEQRETIKTKVSQMKEAEATPEAIKQTVDQMMKGFGGGENDQEEFGKMLGPMMEKLKGKDPKDMEATMNAAGPRSLL